jgi:hypothetical protein
MNLIYFTLYTYNRRSKGLYLLCLAFLVWMAISAGVVGMESWKGGREK